VISVPLEKIVQLNHARFLWPEEFNSIVTAAEEHPAENLRFAVIADWVEAIGEPTYANAWRWLHKRMSPESLYLVQPNERRQTWWRLRGLPDSLANTKTGRNMGEFYNLAHLVANLAMMLEELRSEIES